MTITLQPVADDSFPDVCLSSEEAKTDFPDEEVLKDATMQNIEPAVYRQRLIIEAHYSTLLDEESIRKYLNDLSVILKMKVFAGPFSWPPDERSSS